MLVTFEQAIKAAPTCSCQDDRNLRRTSPDPRPEPVIDVEDFPFPLGGCRVRIECFDILTHSVPCGCAFLSSFTAQQRKPTGGGRVSPQGPETGQERGRSSNAKQPAVGREGYKSRWLRGAGYQLRRTSLSCDIQPKKLRVEFAAVASSWVSRGPRRKSAIAVAARRARSQRRERCHAPGGQELGAHYEGEGLRSGHCSQDRPAITRDPGCRPTEVQRVAMAGSGRELMVCFRLRHYGSRHDNTGVELAASDPLRT